MHRISGLLATFIVIAIGVDDFSKYPENLANLYLINKNGSYYFTFDSEEYYSMKKNAVAMSVALGKSKKCKGLFPIFHMKNRDWRKPSLYTMDLRDVLKWTPLGYDIDGNIGYGARSLGHCGSSIVIVQALISILRDHYFVIRGPRTIMELDNLVSRKINNALTYGHSRPRFKRESRLPHESKPKHVSAPTKRFNRRYYREVASWELRMQEHYEMLKKYRIVFHAWPSLL
ncbi:hypothetical protein M513_12814, partial [Trichuris suis]